MKKRSAILLIIILSITELTNAQESTNDSSFFYRITNARWMPDGTALLISLLKIDTVRKIPPVGKIYEYNLKSKKVRPFEISGGSPAVSPDNNKVLYLKRVDNLDMIMIYDLASKTEIIAVADSFGKYSPSWSADNKKIAYSRKMKSNARESAVEIFVFDIPTGKNEQLTHSSGASSWTPAWAPEENRIAYYLERGDGRDQIWLTDSEGSFFRNLTNDTSTHNYYPAWTDRNTIAYTQSPDATMTIQTNGKNRKKIPGLGGDQVRYNYKAGKAVYVKEEPTNTVFLYDWKEQGTSVLFDLEQLLKEIQIQN